MTDGILFGKIIHSIVGVFVNRRTACRGIEDRIVLRRQRNPSVCTAERTVTRSRTWEIERRLDDHGALRVGTYSRNRRQGRRWWRWTQSNPARKWISNYRIVAADCSQSSTTVCERRNRRKWGKGITKKSTTQLFAFANAGRSRHNHRHLVRIVCCI